MDNFWTFLAGLVQTGDWTFWCFIAFVILIKPIKNLVNAWKVARSRGR